MGRPPKIKDRSKASDSIDSIEAPPERVEKRGRKPGSGRPPKYAQGTVVHHNTEYSSRASPSREESPPLRRTRQATRLHRLGHKDERSERLAELESRPDGIAHRRYGLMRAPYQSPLFERESVFFDGVVYQVGDVVTTRDKVDHKRYFAQIRALLGDCYARQFVAITWLIPRKCAADPHSFDPLHFSHGIVDRKNYPIEAFRLASTCPDLPAYKIKQTPRTIADGRRKLLFEQRLEDIRQLTKEELHNYPAYLKPGDMDELHEEANKELLEKIKAIDALRAEHEETKEKKDKEDVPMEPTTSS